MSTYNHQSGFATNLTTAVSSGATVSFLNQIPTVDPPYYLAFDAANVNSAYEVVEITSATSLSVSHAALSNNHDTTEEIRLIVSAAEWNTLSTDVETDLANSTGTTPTGAIRPWPTTTPPTGYLSCTGVTASRSTYADLYAVIGDTFGAGNGSTTFNLPDAQGKIFFGVDSADGDFHLADTGGAKTANLAHSPTTTNHTHIASGTSGNNSATAAENGTDEATIAQNPHTHAVFIATGAQTDTGTDSQWSASQSILMPYKALLFIIKT